MPKAKNIDTVAKLKEKLERAKGLVLTDYTGLTHKQLEDLHKTLNKVGAEYLVVKNSLLSIASEKKETSVGPTAVMFAYGDELAPVKELYKFIKANTLPKVKGGTINNNSYEAGQIAQLATIPSQEVLYGQVVSGLSSPLYGLAYTLNANLQKLVYVLGQIKKA